MSLHKPTAEDVWVDQVGVIVEADPMDVVTRRDLAKQLEVTLKSVDRLVAVGLLPIPATIGGSHIWDEDKVKHVLDAPPPPKNPPPAIMVKVHERRPAPSGEIPPSRRFVGWDPALSAMDPSQMAGINRWWTAKDPQNWIGETFIVSSIGFVLAVYEILGVHTIQGLRNFELGQPTAEGKRYLGTRFPSERGAILKSWR